jgi:hypothetical protein
MEERRLLTNSLIELDLFFVLFDGLLHLLFHSGEGTSVGSVHFFFGLLLLCESIVEGGFQTG